MKKIFENAYLTFELDSEKSILIYTWSSKSEDLTLEAFLAEATSILTAILYNKVLCVIGNDLNFKFSVVPEVQTQMNETMLAKFNNSNLKKFAHIMSSELITQLSVEQLFEENSSKTYEDKFFDNMEQAKAWCLS